jgi:hypothetical protein
LEFILSCRAFEECGKFKIFFWIFLVFLGFFVNFWAFYLVYNRHLSSVGKFSAFLRIFVVIFRIFGARSHEPGPRNGNDPAPPDRKDPRHAINCEPAARWQHKTGIPKRILLGNMSFLAGCISVHLRYLIVFNCIFIRAFIIGQFSGI